MGRLRAVIYVPGDGDGAEAGRWQWVCVEHCERHGYEIVSVVLDRRSYADAVTLLLDRRAEVLVVGRRDHIPHDRVPRVEVVSETSAARPPTVRGRASVRPRMMRRTSTGDLNERR